MAYLVAGPFIAVVGIVAVLFVFRRKSVDKRSMYAARRQQIEHKVRAARQRTLTPHGHEPKPAAQPGAPPGFAQQPQSQPFEYFQPAAAQSAPPMQAPAFPQTPFEPAAALPAAPPTPPPTEPPPPEPQWETTPAAGAPTMPWETGPTTPAPAPAPEPSFGYPPAPPAEFTPVPQAAPRLEPSEPVWTPAPQPSEPATQIEQPVAASATSAGGWSIVTTTKESAETAAAPEQKKKKGKGKSEQPVGDASWALASGEAPGTEAEEPEPKRLSGTAVALAQYAVLVVGLVMVLIGVLVMVANSHVT